MSRSEDSGLEREFQGPEVLQALLEIAGCALSVEEVAQHFLAAQSQKSAAADVIPELFPQEPRFSSPDAARMLFGNLLGLWDLLAAGKPLPRALPPRPPKPPRVEAPEPWAAEPTDDFIAAAQRYLEANPRERERRVHAFENRQDALLSSLDEEALEDVPDAVARQLLFGLHVLLELGWNGRVKRVRDARLSEATPAAALPPALLRFIEGTLTAAQQNSEAPLAAQDVATVRRVAHAGLSAWWRAGSEGV